MRAPPIGSKVPPALILLRRCHHHPPPERFDGSMPPWRSGNAADMEMIARRGCLPTLSAPLFAPHDQAHQTRRLLGHQDMPTYRHASDRVKVRGMFKVRGAAFGLLAGLGSLIALAAQIRPEDAGSNLSAWYKLLAGNAPDAVPPPWLAMPVADRWATALGINLLLLAWAGWWLTKRSPISPGFAQHTDRPDMSFLDAFCYVHTHPRVGPARAKKTGLGQIIAAPQTYEMLRDEARRGSLTVWGLKESSRRFDNASGTIVREYGGSLVPIPPEHWVSHRIDNDSFEGTSMRGRSEPAGAPDLLADTSTTFGLLQFSERQLHNIWPPVSKKEDSA